MRLQWDEDVRAVFGAVVNSSRTRRQVMKLGSRYYFMRPEQASMVAAMPRRRARVWLARNWRRVMPCEKFGDAFMLKTGSPWLSGV